VHIRDAGKGSQAFTLLPVDDLAQRIAKNPGFFHLKAQLAEPGRFRTKDASLPWPDDRKSCDLVVLAR